MLTYVAGAAGEDVRVLRDELRHKEAASQTLKDELKALKDESKALTDQLQGLKDELRHKEAASQTLKDELKALKDELQTLKDETQAVRAAAAAEVQSKSRVVLLVVRQHMSAYV